MNSNQLEYLATLRAVVAYLGENEQFDWWHTSFYVAGCKTFLAPLFPRTQFLAQCRGASQAAAVVHDQHIGIGNVYHLFRLPEDLEQGIHRILHDTDVCGRVATRIASVEAAMAFLRGSSSGKAEGGVGPVRVGDRETLRGKESWHVAAVHYARAFEERTKTYPFFADRS